MPLRHDIKGHYYLVVAGPYGKYGTKWEGSDLETAKSVLKKQQNHKMIVEFIDGKMKNDPHYIGPNKEHQGGWNYKYWHNWNDIRKLQNVAKDSIGMTHILTSATITNRKDCCENRLTGVGVHTVEWGQEWKLRGKVKGHVGRGAKYTVKFQKAYPSVAIKRTKAPGQYLQFTGI